MKHSKQSNKALLENSNLNFKLIKRYEEVYTVNKIRFFRDNGNHFIDLNEKQLSRILIILKNLKGEADE